MLHHAVQQPIDFEQMKKLLDEREVALDDGFLAITDADRVVALAGVMGGWDTRVTETTTSVFLESAHFAPDAIIGRARRLGLHTDASHRFERGVDPQLPRLALERATALVLEIMGGQAGAITEAVLPEHLPQPAAVALRRERLRRVLGVSVADAEVERILRALGMQVSATAEGWSVLPPTRRFDIAIEEDLIEEVARVYGFDRIPETDPATVVAIPALSETKLSPESVADLLIQRGYFEAITYSFVDPKAQQLLYPQSDAIVLPNPISVEMSAMRVSLFPGLVQAVVYNQNRQQARVRLFEQGLRFIKDASAENGIRQEPMLAGIITGNQSDEHWDIKNRGSDFFDLKGDLEAVLDLTAEGASFSFERTEHSALHPGQSAAILRNGAVIGHIGVIHPSLEKKLGLKSRAVMFELELDKLTPAKVPVAAEVSRFPANRRDIAVVVDVAVLAGDVLAVIKKVGGNQLVGINLFDVYQGAGMAEDKKSLAISLVLQDTQRTLEEKEIAETVDNVVRALGEELNASLRD